MISTLFFFRGLTEIRSKFLRLSGSARGGVPLQVASRRLSRDGAAALPGDVPHAVVGALAPRRSASQGRRRSHQEQQRRRVFSKRARELRVDQHRRRVPRGVRALPRHGRSTHTLLPWPLPLDLWQLDLCSTPPPPHTLPLYAKERPISPICGGRSHSVFSHIPSI